MENTISPGCGRGRVQGQPEGSKRVAAVKMLGVWPGAKAEKGSLMSRVWRWGIKGWQFDHRIKTARARFQQFTIARTKRPFGLSLRCEPFDVEFSILTFCPLFFPGGAAPLADLRFGLELPSS